MDTAGKTLMGNSSIQEPGESESTPVPVIGEWTPRQIERFWEYFSRRPSLYPEYFSKRVGDGVANFLFHAGRLRQGAVILDYGCGPGFLLEHLLRYHVRGYGIDGSRQAVEHANETLKVYPNWMGASQVATPPTPYPDATFDLVTCLETIEHLLDDWLGSVLSDIRRILKPGGAAFFTTPNEENLAHNYTLCPFCNTEFHQMQHVRTFSAESLKEVLEANGFKVLFCKGVDFSRFQRPQPKWSEWGLGTLYNWFEDKRIRVLDRVQPRPFPNARGFRTRVGQSGPNLCAIVERPL